VHYFTLEEARQLLPEARRRLEDIAELSADLQDQALAIHGGEAPNGAIPEAKALEARIDEQLGWFREQGVQVKGIAPALLDFPAKATVSGKRSDVLLCWREGEDDLTHFHPLDTGYLGRRPITAAEEI
jgi:hypothetical protein